MSSQEASHVRFPGLPYMAGSQGTKMPHMWCCSLSCSGGGAAGGGSIQGRLTQGRLCLRSSSSVCPGNLLVTSLISWKYLPCRSEQGRPKTGIGTMERLEYLGSRVCRQGGCTRPGASDMGAALVVSD